MNQGVHLIQPYSGFLLNGLRHVNNTPSRGISTIIKIVMGKQELSCKSDEDHENESTIPRDMFHNEHIKEKAVMSSLEQVHNKNTEINGDSRRNINQKGNSAMGLEDDTNRILDRLEREY